VVNVADVDARLVQQDYQFLVHAEGELVLGRERDQPEKLGHNVGLALLLTTQRGWQRVALEVFGVLDARSVHRALDVAIPRCNKLAALGDAAIRGDKSRHELPPVLQRTTSVRGTHEADYLRLL